jgi:Xaa-Pro aminopeptidase
MTAGLMEVVRPTLPTNPDLARMQRDRMQKVRDLMRAQGLDVLVLLGNSNVAYVTGLGWPLSDSGRATFERPVAVVTADDPVPHLFTPMRTDDRVLAALPADHLHHGTYLDFDEGVERFVKSLAGLVPAGAKVALDEWTHAMARERSLLFAADPIDAGRVIGGAKLLKTPDEIACMREGLRISEVAVAEVQKMVAPGVRQSDLTATFLRTLFEAGVDANVMDPVWQVMAPRVADGPWTTTGEVACPLLTTERVLEKGDVIWNDVSTTFGGMHTDFGRTWIVGRDPNARERELFDKWQNVVGAVLAVTRAGARASDLTAAAIDAYGGVIPWMPHFYLGHGLGIDSAELPFIGSDIGTAFDEATVLEAGMVIVLEPNTWEDGAAGYRSEEVLVVTEDGWLPMTDYPYDPF